MYHVHTSDFSAKRRTVNKTHDNINTHCKKIMIGKDPHKQKHIVRQATGDRQERGANQKKKTKFRQARHDREERDKREKRTERNTQAKIEETGMREERHAKRWREVIRGGSRENKRGGWETEYNKDGEEEETKVG